MVTPYLGQISMIAFTFAPRGWAMCDGQTIQVSENPSLYALLSTHYGGDGTSYFKLPDFRGRVPIHSGEGIGLSLHRLGEFGGTETVVLQESQMPAHSHTSTPQLTVTTPAVDSNATQTSPGPNTVLGIGNYSNMGNETIVNNYSDANPTTNLKPAAVSGTVAIGTTGGSQAHLNIQPFLTVNFVISLDGVFPPRN